jgi:hypothetical protein
MYWARLACWISSCYDPFLIGERFETYEPLISLIFHFFVGGGGGGGKPPINVTVEIESMDTGALPYTYII